MRRARRYKVIVALSGMLAVFFLCLLPLWILNIPGRSDSRAAGLWNTGFVTLVLYGGGWFVVYFAENLIRFNITQSGKQEPPAKWDNYCSAAYLLIMGVAIVIMLRLFLVATGYLSP